MVHGKGGRDEREKTGGTRASARVSAGSPEQKRCFSKSQRGTNKPTRESKWDTATTSKRIKHVIRGYVTL